MFYTVANKKINVLYYVHTFVYTRERKKTMIIPNNLNELDDKKMTNAFETEIVFSRKRDKLIHVRMTKEEKIAIEMMAEYHNLPVSAYIRALVKQDARRQRQITKIKEAGGSVD